MHLVSPCHSAAATANAAAAACAADVAAAAYTAAYVTIMLPSAGMKRSDA